jgi:hypothetical protein
MTWAAGACTIALLMLGAGVAQAQFNIDHYIVYRDLMPFPAGLQVDLIDQFGPSSTILLNRDKFANPADKTHPPELPDIQNILYPDEHLSWWRFEVPVPNSKNVLVTNQFGPDQPWRLGDAEYLLVPAIKEQVGDIVLNQHYECYIALEAPPVGIPVNLLDQFDLQLDVVVEQARYLCNPVEKLGPPPLVPSGPPVFPQDHLACYDITGWPSPWMVSVEDQVFVEIDQLEEAEMLCVPSTKTIIEPTPSLAPWGVGALGGLMLLTVFWAARRRVRQRGLA